MTAVRPRSRYQLLALALLAMCFLSGCMRVHVALAISQDDLVSGEMIIAALPTRDGDPGPPLTIPPELTDRVRMEKYAADGYVGQKLLFSDLRFADVTTLSEGITSGKQQYRLSFRRSGDLVSMSGSIDLTQLPADKADVEVKMSFPGSINRTNGINDEGTVAWHPKPGAVTEFDVTAEYTDTSGGSWVKWAMIVVGAAVGVAIMVVLLALLVHRRGRKQFAAEQAQATVSWYGSAPG
jgi:hypothetical protein